MVGRKEDMTMRVIENETFSGNTILVDGTKFTGCTFEEVALLYKGGDLPEFVNCQFDGVSLQFGEAAANTLKFLSAVRGRGFAGPVDRILAAVTTK